eukprot:8799878-Lingulodinium_polyedra.AAC.1
MAMMRNHGQHPCPRDGNRCHHTMATIAIVEWQPLPMRLLCHAFMASSCTWLSTSKQPAGEDHNTGLSMYTSKKPA